MLYKSHSEPVCWGQQGEGRALSPNLRKPWKTHDGWLILLCPGRELIDSSHKSFLCFSGEIVQRTESRHRFGKAHPAPLLRFLCISPPLRPPTTSLHIHPVSILLIFPHFYLLQPLLLGKRTTILQRREESLSCQIWMHVMCRHIKRRAVCAPLLRLAAAFRNARLWGFSYFISLFWCWFESKRSIKSKQHVYPD